MATTTTVPTFAEAGTVFNDATHFLEGGLWQNAVSEGGQGLGSAGRVVTDLQNVQASVQAGIAGGQFTGAALTDAKTIVANLNQEIEAANASVSGGGAFGSVAAAQTALHTLHLGVLNTVAADPALAALATAGGATGFQAAPAAFADGVNAHNVPHQTLADIGAIFNDAANQMIGGVNSSNIATIRADINTARTDLQHLMTAHPDEFGGLTGIHADTVVRQLALENKFLNQVGTNPDAGRASNDNMLDIIDIVQGDTNLANMATQNGVSGFSAFPDKMGATPKYMDNADQTTFWSNFIAQSNSLGAAAEAAVAAGNKQDINGVVAQLHAFEKTSSNFDQSQGGIFEARFDNELAKGTSTLGAEVAAMIKGLKSGDAALVTAAAEQMHANAADVGGNNVPVNGTAYNTDALTAADALGQAPAVAAGGAGAVAPAPVNGTVAGAAPAGGTPAVAAAHVGVPDAPAAPQAAAPGGNAATPPAPAGTAVASTAANPAAPADQPAHPAAQATGAATASNSGTAPDPGAHTLDTGFQPLHDFGFGHHQADHHGHLWG